MATGLLIVCVGKSTKVVDRLVLKQSNAFLTVYFWTELMLMWFPCRQWSMELDPEKIIIAADIRV